MGFGKKEFNANLASQDLMNDCDESDDSGQGGESLSSLSIAEKPEFVSKVVVLLGYEHIETVAHLTLWELNNLLGYARRFLDGFLRRVDPGHVLTLGQST